MTFQNSSSADHENQILGLSGRHWCRTVLSLRSVLVVMGENRRAKLCIWTVFQMLVWLHYHQISGLLTFGLPFDRLLSLFSLVVASGINEFHHPAATPLLTAFPLGPHQQRAGLALWLSEDSGDTEMPREV